VVSVRLSYRWSLTLIDCSFSKVTNSVARVISARLSQTRKQRISTATRARPLSLPDDVGQCVCVCVCVCYRRTLVTVWTTANTLLPTDTLDSSLEEQPLTP